jgi:hypothetical protein
LLNISKIRFNHPDANKVKNSIALLVLLLLLCQCQQNESVIDLKYTPAKVELFGEGMVSTSLYERDMAISQNGDEIIFTLGDYRQSKRCLVSIKKTGDIWGEKEILSFSGLFNDIEPFLSYDGRKLYFASDRPMETNSKRGDYNIWVVERNNIGWSEPKPLERNINSINDEFYPSLSRNNNLYFTSVRKFGIGSEDIFLSKYIDGKFQDPVLLDTTINTVADEFNAYINPEENLIIFSSYGRKDDIGQGDLYYSKKDNEGKWAEALNMGPLINSDKLDYCPFIDIPRGNFYFTSERTFPSDKRITSVGELEQLANGVLNGMGNIYRIKFDKLNLPGD